MEMENTQCPLTVEQTAVKILVCRQIQVYYLRRGVGVHRLISRHVPQNHQSAIVANQNLNTSKQNCRIPIYCKLVRILEAKDVLPNINRTQATKKAEKCRFCPW